MKRTLENLRVDSSTCQVKCAYCGEWADSYSKDERGWYVTLKCNCAGSAVIVLSKLVLKP